MSAWYPIIDGASSRQVLGAALGLAQAGASLEREARRYQSLERATRWIKPMFALTPLVGEGSPYGATLGILVEALSQQRVAQPARGGRKTFARECSHASPAHSSSCSFESVATHSNGRGSVLPLSRQMFGSISASGAARCTGAGIASAATSGASAASFSAETGVAIPAPGAAEFGSEDPGVANISCPVSTTTTAMLREQLAQRAATRLASMRASGDHTVVARALMGQWGSPLDGFATGEGLLLEASAAQPDGAMVRAPAAESLPLAPTYASPVAPEAENEARAGVPSVPAIVPAGTAGALAPLPSPSLAPSATLTEEIFFRSGSTLEAGNFRHTSRAGTILAETGSSLVGGPDFPAVEDLDLETTEAFSAKLKRVLDEEARRYGIDV